MQAPITLFVYTNQSTISVGDETMLHQFNVDVEELLKRSEGRLRRYEIWLKEPLTYALQLQVERACFADAAQRLPAMVEAYVEKWTLPGPPTAAGFLALHPNIADKVGVALTARIFPMLGGQPDFFDLVAEEWKAEQDQIPQRNSQSEASVSSIAA